MKLRVVIHRAEEGGFWAEVPGFPGCVSEGETLEEVRRNWPFLRDRRIDSYAPITNRMID